MKVPLKGLVHSSPVRSRVRCVGVMDRNLPDAKPTPNLERAREPRKRAGSAEHRRSAGQRGPDAASPYTASRPGSDPGRAADPRARGHPQAARTEAPQAEVTLSEPGVPCHLAPFCSQTGSSRFEKTSKCRASCQFLDRKGGSASRAKAGAGAAKPSTCGVVV